MTTPKNEMAQANHSTGRHAVRRQRLMDSIGVADADAVLISDPTNVTYLTGFTGDSSQLLLGRDRSLMLSDGRYEHQLTLECPGLTTRIRPPSQSMGELIGEVLGDSRIVTDRLQRNVARIAIESDQVTLSTMESLRQAAPETEFVGAIEMVAPLRQIKDADEINATRRAIEIAQEAFLKVRSGITPEMTELEISWQLEHEMRVLGADGVSFELIVAAGPTGALPHYRPARRPIGDQSTLLIDWGGKYGGYCSDLSRTLHRPDASDEFKRAYDAVLEAQLAAIAAIVPGKSGTQIDAVAREILQKHGLADAFTHSLGHGIGLFVHEGPRLSAVAQDVLTPGMIVTVEPGVYFPGKFGIRIEDDVLVTEGGHEVLSSLPKGLEESCILL